jgi:endonuclease/exonuclease/phosphatase family metal-dependent hydrolase
MKVKSVLIVFFASISFLLSGQETIKMMQYNLLYYGSYTDWCTSSNNNISDKADNLAIIIGHVQPDIFTVNEMDPSSYAVNHLLGNALNVNGVTHYRSAAILNQDGGSLINMLYYDNTKLEILSQESVTNGLRDINIYEMRHLNVVPQVRFRVAVAHLKAGYDDSSERAYAISQFMEYWSNQSDKRNVIFAGDFNVYTSDEPAYQNLINPSQGNIQFVDPVDQPGDWGEYSFRYYHTQSTHDGDDGCPSYGGMDDRFDFIMVSEDVMNGENGMLYVEDSYTTLGQDGNRYNGSLINPTNTSAPSDVIYAMYNFSDHLPIIAEFELGETGIAEFSSQQNFSIEQLEVSESSIRFDLLSELPKSGTMVLYNMLGRLITSTDFSFQGRDSFKLPVSESGLMVLQICTDDGQCESLRIIK